MLDQTPITWADGVTLLNDSTLNAEIRNAYQLLLCPPLCVLHASSAQTIPTGTGFTVLTWNDMWNDTESPLTMYSAGSPTRITIRTPGWYFVNGQLDLGSTDATVLVSVLAARVNGATIYRMGSTMILGTKSLYVSAGTMIPLNASDYVELLCTHTSTLSMTLSSNTNMPLFSAVRWRGL